MSGIWKARLAADQDIDEIADHIRADSVEAAIRFVRVVRDAFDLLAMFPRAGPVRKAKSAELAGLRSWPLGGRFSNYLIFYIEREYGVEILRVLHGMRDVDSIIDSPSQV